MPDLCTLSDIKNWLGITDTNSDTLLNRLITSTSQDFLNETRRQDLTPATDYIDFLFGGNTCRPWPIHECADYRYWSLFGRQEIFVPHWPINSITGMSLNGTVLTEVTDLNDVSQTGWFFDDANLIGEDRCKFLLVGYSFLYNGCGSWLKIESNAGYATVPAAVSQAIIEWVAFHRSQSILQTQNPAATGFKIGDYEQSQAIAPLMLDMVKAPIPASVQDVIDKYSRPGSF